MATTTEPSGIVQLVKDSTKSFVASLSSEEQVLFQTTTAAESVLRELETANSEHKDASNFRKASAALLPFVAGIEQYGQAMDVFANSNDLLCPIWGSVRIVLHVRLDSRAFQTWRICY